MRRVFAETMLSVGKEDPKLVVMVGDISHFSLQPFAKACPGKFYNVGILEPTIVGMAAGLSSIGFHPVAHTIAPFLIERSYEQIKLDFCYQGLGGTLISVGSAFDYSGLGCSHHCYGDLALLKALPNTEVIFPAMPAEFRALFRQTYRNNKLTYFRLPGESHGVEIREDQVQLGKGMVIRPGTDVTLIGAGPRLKTMMAAAERLKDCGVSAEVLHFATLKPFDEETLAKSLRKTGSVIVMEEHSSTGGFSEEVRKVAFQVGPVRGLFLAIPDEFQRGYGHYEDHLHALGFTAENVVEKSVGLVNESRRSCKN